MQANVYIREEDIPLWKAFDEVCRKEGGRSKVLRRFIAEYVKKHGKGNPSYPLTSWLEDPQLKAYPAFMGAWEKVDLRLFDTKDLEAMKMKALHIQVLVERELKHSRPKGMK